MTQRHPWSDDPVAAKTSTRPHQGGGANFCTHRLRIRGDRAFFRPTLLSHFFGCAFVTFGLMVLGMLSVGVFTDYEPLLGLLGLGALFAVPPIVIGARDLYGTWSPRMFDRTQGRFQYGRERNANLRLTDLYALQIVYDVHTSTDSETGSTTRFKSYELNAVRRDGTRVGVVDHGNGRKLREDAARLGAFLRVPVWDTTKR